MVSNILLFQLTLCSLFSQQVITSLHENMQVLCLALFFFNWFFSFSQKINVICKLYSLPPNIWNSFFCACFRISEVSFLVNLTHGSLSLPSSQREDSYLFSISLLFLNDHAKKQGFNWKYENDLYKDIRKGLWFVYLV